MFGPKRILNSSLTRESSITYAIIPSVPQGTVHCFYFLMDFQG